MAADADGDFVVVWDSVGSGGTDASLDSVQGQRYASSGSAIGGEFQVNTLTSLAQGLPAAAMDAADDFVVAWESEGSSGTDMDGESVQMARFRQPGPLWVPGFEVEVANPEGPTTFFAVRNTTDAAVEVDVAYHGERSSVPESGTTTVVRGGWAPRFMVALCCRTKLPRRPLKVL